MKAVLAILVVVGLFSYAVSYSQSKSCSSVNGVMTCRESTDPNGNGAGAMSGAFSGPQGGSGFNSAGAGQFGGGWNQQSSRFTVGIPPVVPSFPFGNFGGMFGGMFPGGVGAMAMAGRR